MKKAGLIDRLSAKGERLRAWISGSVPDAELDAAVAAAHDLNPFFTPYMQRRSLEAVASRFLDRKALNAWVERYGISPDVEYPDDRSPRCGIVAAGNIPAVAVQDILSALVSGWRPVVKMSSKDRYLLPALFPEIDYVDGPSQLYGCVDALLSMGSDAAARSLNERFSALPRVVRGSRFSLAVLRGSETEEALAALAEDMLLYYGMGCRSVTVLLVPSGYDFSRLSVCLAKFAEAHLEKVYFDNLRRSRAVCVLGQEDFRDGGVILYRNLVPNSDKSLSEILMDGPSLPLANVWYGSYRSDNEIERYISSNRNRIQKIFRNFGIAQKPALEDYPDGTDTVRFLMEQKKKRQ